MALSTRTPSQAMPPGDNRSRLCKLLHKSCWKNLWNRAGWFSIFSGIEPKGGGGQGSYFLAHTQRGSMMVIIIIYAAHHLYIYIHILGVKIWRRCTFSWGQDAEDYRLLVHCHHFLFSCRGLLLGFLHMVEDHPDQFPHQSHHFCCSF